MLVCIRNLFEMFAEKLVLLFDRIQMCYIMCMDPCADPVFSSVCRGVDLSDWDNVVVCNNKMFEICREICNKTCYNKS